VELRKVKTQVRKMEQSLVRVRIDHFKLLGKTKEDRTDEQRASIQRRNSINEGAYKQHP